MKFNEIDLFDKIHELNPLAAIKYKNNTSLYRGIRGTVDKWVQPPVNRRAANTLNYVNVFVSNSPAWASYPRRDASFICTDSRRHAKLYGNPHIVIPLGNPMIGVCEETDFWNGFTRGLHLEVDDFNEYLQSIAMTLNRKKPDPRCVPIMHDTASYADINAFIELCRERYVAGEALIITDEFMETLVSLEDALRPEVNGFTLMRYSDYTPIDYEREIWFSAPAYMISCS